MDIKWIKITVDIFDDEKIKLIDCLPDRDCVLVIWFKLLALTGKKNECGVLFMTPKMPYTDEMLSTIFNRPLNSVRLALNTFQDFGMIEINDNKVINVVNWEKHQNIEGMEKIREQNRIRKQNQREKQKVLPVKGHVTSREDHATDKDKDKKKSKKKNNNKEAFASSPFFGWRNDFLIYEKYVKDGFGIIMNDKDFTDKITIDFPYLNIKETVRKAYTTYWKTEDGWDKKTNGKSKQIDFKKTVRAILRQDFNHVYKDKSKNTKPKYQNNNEPTFRPEQVILNHDR